MSNAVMMILVRYIKMSLVVAAFLCPAGATTAAERTGGHMLEADFVMTRTMAVLKDAVRSTGKLVLGGPGLLRWETTSPAKSILVVNQGRGWLHYPELGVTKAFDIAVDPVMKLLADHLIALSTGDFGALREMYTITEASKGTKRLVPKRPEVLKLFTEMRVTAGATGDITGVALVSAGGDTTAIEFFNVNNHPTLPQSTFEDPGKKGP